MIGGHLGYEWESVQKRQNEIFNNHKEEVMTAYLTFLGTSYISDKSNILNIKMRITLTVVYINSIFLHISFQYQMF